MTSNSRIIIFSLFIITIIAGVVFIITSNEYNSRNPLSTEKTITSIKLADLTQEKLQEIIGTEFFVEEYRRITKEDGSVFYEASIHNPTEALGVELEIGEIIDQTKLNKFIVKLEPTKVKNGFIYINPAPDFYAVWPTEESKYIINIAYKYRTDDINDAILQRLLNYFPPSELD